jgi:hypothetical protein
MNERVLIVGRSAPVLIDAVAALRRNGFGANATNQFDQLLNEYDPRDIDLVVFGGQVPAEQRTELESAMARRNPHIRFVNGLGGVAPLLVAQIEEYFGRPLEGVTYDASARDVRVRLETGAHVEVSGVWAVPVGSEPSARSEIAHAGDLAGGEHAIPLPDDVPAQGAFVIVRVDGRVAVFPVAETSPVRRGTGRTLPVAEPVSTRLPWEAAA